MQLFKTEKDALKWVTMNIAICVKPKRKAKTVLVYPFASFHAQEEVIKHLAKDLYQYQKDVALYRKSCRKENKTNGNLL